MSELLKVEVETMEVKLVEEKKKKKPRKFKPENRCVELTTVEVRLVMGGGEAGHGWMGCLGVNVLFLYA